jgi:hypothetical protein
VTVSTPFHFLSLFIKASTNDIHDTENNILVENLAYFLSELTMINFSTLEYNPSMIFVVVVYAAKSIILITPNWTEKLILQTTYMEEQVEDYARSLVRFHSKVKKFLAIVDKYDVV